MSNNNTAARRKGFHSLSQRIVINFCLFTLFLSALYGLVAFMLLYTLEDSFIVKDIKREAEYLQSGFTQDGVWPNPRKDTMQLHFGTDSLPDDFRDKYIQEPWEHEFYGSEGLHYHLYPLPGHDKTYLVAEVSQELLVRPIRGGVLVFLIVNGIALTLFACLMAWILGRRTTAPLKKLAALVDGVKPEQLPKRFASEYPNNEIGTLANALESSMQRINASMDREKYFTRDVSHELRTPLAVIRNGSELLQAQNMGTDAKATVNRIAAAAEQMEKTVYTLLALAREENTASEATTFALMPLVERAILDNRTLLDDKDIEVVIEDNCHAQLTAQSGMLKVLLDNLLSNAFQYTQQGEVIIAFSDGWLRVRDTGPGINQELSSKITEPGVKGKQSTGFGFGLSIVKRLCEHQGWRLKVESGAEAEQRESGVAKSGNGTQISVLLGEGS